MSFATLTPPPLDPVARRRLLARIARRYGTTSQTVELGTLRLPFTRIADPDRVLDEVAAEVDRLERQTGQREQDLQQLPYWAELWDSAHGMAQYVQRAGIWTLAGRSEVGPSADVDVNLRPNVLDLGCGMGLTGTVAAALGARVLFADLMTPPLLFARLNSLPWRGRVRTRKLNWRADQLGETFDLILGADILYEREQWGHLDPFWRAHLAPGGSVLLGEPGRQTGDAFIDWIPTQGWRLEMHEEPVITRPRPIRIFRLTLPLP